MRHILLLLLLCSCSPTLWESGHKYHSYGEPIYRDSLIEVRQCFKWNCVKTDTFYFNPNHWKIKHGKN